MVTNRSRDTKLTLKMGETKAVEQTVKNKTAQSNKTSAAPYKRMLHKRDNQESYQEKNIFKEFKLN